MVDVEGVTGPLASEGPSTIFPSRLVSLISAEVLSSFWGLYFLSFSFPPVSLIRNLSISLLPCLTGCLVASALCTLATTFFEVEDTGDMGGDSKANCNRRVLESHKKGEKDWKLWCQIRHNKLGSSQLILVSLKHKIHAAITTKLKSFF